MNNALRAVVLLACSWSVVLLSRTSTPSSNHDGDWVIVLAAVVPFVLAVIVAWRGHDR